MNTDRIWKCRDGREIPIADMETRHLENTVAMLRRKGFVTRDDAVAMFCGPSPSGDGACIAYEMELDSIRISASLPYLEAELEARKNGKRPPAENFAKAAGYVARGYRRVSNKYGTVARVDRPDWLEVLAESMGRCVADFYIRGKVNELGHGWADHYRRCYSKDTIDLPPAIAKLVPGSGSDPVGYAP